MRESPSRTFRLAVDAAQAAARQLNQDFVSTEHLVIGVLKTEGEATRALAAAHADVAALTAAMLQSLPDAVNAPVVSGALPLSPRAQRCITESIVAAQAGRETVVSTRYLLLALLDEPGSLVRRCLSGCGADLETVRKNLAERPTTVEP
jgi:ATP-dependent Clp protease ATP-binding subunit ClpC